MRSYFDGMLRYFEFSGRSTRRQYWLFWLIATLACLGAAYVDYRLYGALPTLEQLGPFTAFASIVHTIPGITVTVRRLHDGGRSGWWYLIQLVPLVGGIVLLVWMCRGPREWDNPYGPDPRREIAATRMPREQRSTIPRAVRMGNATPPRPVFSPETGAPSQRFI